MQEAGGQRSAERPARATSDSGGEPSEANPAPPGDAHATSTLRTSSRGRQQRSEGELGAGASLAASLWCALQHDLAALAAALGCWEVAGGA